MVETNSSRASHVTSVGILVRRGRRGQDGGLDINSYRLFIYPACTQ